MCFCVLGRYGDVMILLPGLKALYDSTGVKPVVVVSKEFACLFNGVSYAVAHPVAFDCYRDVRSAVAFAIRTYGDCIVPKWWDDPRKKGQSPRIPTPWFMADAPKAKTNEVVTLRYKGEKLVLAKEDWENYMVSQWEHAGFTRAQMMEWPLVFDRRNKEAEVSLVQRVFHTQKPKLLYNFGGVTSPLPKPIQTPMNQMINRLGGKFEIINLAHVRANCIYDLLGLYDRAAIVMSTDTATLHLCRASNVPYVALVANSGSGSVTFANCKLRVRYHNIQANLAKIEAALAEAA